MSSPPPLPKSAKLIILCILVLVAAPFVVLLAWHISWRARNANQVATLEEQARRLGEPLTLNELASKYYPPVPPDQNAAVPLLEVWETEQPEFWRAFRKGEQTLPERPKHQSDPALPLNTDTKRRVRSSPLSEESRAAVEEYVKTNATHIEAVRAALQRPRCAFPVQITNGFNTLLPYLAEMKNEAQNFRMVCELAMEQNKFDKALSALEDIKRTGQALRGEPLLIDQLVRISCLAMVLEESQRLLSRYSLSTADLKRLQNLFNELDVKGGLKTALIAERASSLSVFSLSPQAVARLGNSSTEDSGSEANNLGARAGMSLLKTSGLAGADRRLMMDTYAKAIAFIHADSAVGLQEYEQLFANVQKEALRFPPKIFSAMMLPALSRAGTRFASFEGKRRAGLAALAVENYRLTHAGRLPEKLEELIPNGLAEVPKDPYNDKPLRFHPLQPGFVIYSIGSDRHDDGGKERPPKGSAQGSDDVFMVER